MTDELVEQTIARAAEQAYDQWAAEHPSLAAVIDRIELTVRVAESLRESEQYVAAVEAYHRSRGEQDLLSRLLELAGPIVQAILAG